MRDAFDAAVTGGADGRATGVMERALGAACPEGRDLPAWGLVTVTRGIFAGADRVVISPGEVFCLTGAFLLAGALWLTVAGCLRDTGWAVFATGCLRLISARLTLVLLGLGAAFSRRLLLVTGSFRA
jgi:hypothetical protein